MELILASGYAHRDGIATSTVYKYTTAVLYLTLSTAFNMKTH